MATIKRRGEAWRVGIRRKSYPTISGTFDSKADVQRWATEIEGDMSRARFLDIRDAEQTNVADALRRYRREITDTKKGARQESVRVDRWLEDGIAKKSLATLRSSDLAAWRDAHLKEGKAGSTVRLNLAIISHLYTIAIKEWGIQGITSLCAALRMPKPSKSHDRRPSAAEPAAVIDAAAKHHRELPIIIQLAVETAMRRSELNLLRRDQIRGKVAYLEDTKNGERRSVPLSQKARNLIATLPTRIDGRLFEMIPNAVSNTFPKSCRDAGIVGLTFHDLRHEATSRLFEAGFNVMEVASITGHKTLAMLKRYTHLSPHDLADRMART
ncbi:MAG: integrase [Halopseudomonas sp.]|jgi:integrase|uniref:tyrosine-type recombinase/integrase n=1 Tax=Halopseudomonas sp. TaxID=2901191 RepID=UPI0039E61A2F